MKWAIKDKLHFEILIAVIWVSNLFQNISYSNQTTNNETKTEKNTFKVIKSHFKEIEESSNRICMVTTIDVILHCAK